MTAKSLAITGLTASNKVYDGTNTAPLGGTAALLSAETPGTGTTNDGKPYSGDDISASGTAAGVFSDRNAGTGKAVTVTGNTLSGTEAGNYNVTQQTGLTATITQKAITVTAVADSKTADGTTTSTGTPTIAPGLAPGDTSGFLQTFDTAAAGTGKTLTPSGIVNDGNGGANYSVTFVPVATGTINPAAANAYRIAAASSASVAGVSNALTITLVDRYQNLTSYTGDKTLTFSGLGNSPGGTAPTVTSKTGTPVALGLATTVSFANGVSSAGGVLTAYKAEGPVTLHVSDGTLSDTTTGGQGAILTVSNTVAAKLAFGTQPTNTALNQAITPAVTVLTQDPYGNTVQEATNRVAIAIAFNPTNGVLSGTLSNTAAAGVTTFGDLHIDTLGTGYTLAASSLPLAGTTSTPFTITPEIGTFRTHQSGNWNATTTWERWSGTAWVTPAPATPSYTDALITLQSAHSVTVTVAVTVDQLVVETGAQLAVNSVLLTVADGAGVDLDLRGTLSVAGATLPIINAGATVALRTGSLLNTAAGLTISGAVGLETASTLLSQGTVTISVGGALTNSGGTIWLAANTSTTPTDALAVNGSLVLMDGTNGIKDLSGAGTLAMSGGLLKMYHDYKPTTPANFVCSGGTFEIAGTAGGAGFGTVGTYRFCNLLIDSGVSAAFDTAGNIYRITGNWTNNGTAVLTGASVSFEGTGAQSIGGAAATPFSTLIISNASAAVTLAMDASVGTAGTVTSGSRLTMADNVISGAGSFTVASGATLDIGHAGGLNGNITVNGTKSFSGGANYIYNGTVAQVTGTLLPTTLTAALSIANSNGVTLSQSTALTSPGACVVTNAGLFTLGSAIVLSGTGSFTLLPGTTLACAHVNGINGNVTTSTKTLDAAANYLFNGPAAQVTGSLLPASLTGNLTIANGNGSGVTLSQSTAVNAPGTCVVNTGALLTLGATTVLSGSGAFTLSAGAALASAHVNGLDGNLTIAAKTFDPAASYLYNGTGAQVTGSLLPGSVSNLTFNNGAGVTLTETVNVNGALTLTNGIVSTGSKYLGIGAAGTVSRSNGHVNGNLRKTFAAGSQPFTFPVGDAATYAPVAITSMTVGTTGTLTATTSGGEHPAIASSGIDATQDVNRYWTLTPSGSFSASGIGATFNYAAGDVDAGASTAAFVIRRYTGSSWASTTTGTRNATSTSITGLSAFGDFAAGETYLIDHYTVTAASPQTAGVAFVVSVAAEDSFNQVIEANSSTSVTMFATGSAQYDANGDGTFGDAVKTLAAGRFTITNRDLVAETVTLTATDAGGKTGSTSVTIVPAAATKLVILAQPTNATAGAAFSPAPVVAIQDAFGNLRTSDALTVTAVRATGTLALQGTTNVVASSGLATFTNLSYNKSETITVTFTNRALAGVTSSNIVVSPSAFSQLQVLMPGETNAPGTGSGKTGTAQAKTLGTVFDVTVNAVDAYWNPISTTDTVRITSGDPLATLPANAALTNGTRPFTVTLWTAGTQSITAWDVSNAGIASNTATVTITPLPSLTVSDVTVTEGNSGTTNAIFRISQSAVSTRNTTFDFFTADGTATTADNDYIATNGTLTIAIGQTNTTVTVPVVGDTVYEGSSELFYLRLTNVVAATLADGQGQCTITNDDARPELRISDVSVVEGDEGTVNAAFTVALSKVIDVNATANFVTSNGTAKAGVDYVATNGLVIVPAGQTSAVINVSVNGDTVYEGMWQDFFVRLTNATDADLIVSVAQGKILNDDYPWSFALGDDFEDDFGYWRNVGGDTSDWFRASAPRNGNTGPISGNTNEDSAAAFIFMNSAGGFCDKTNENVFLESPDLDADIYSIDLSFYYHMFGSTMGTLFLDVYDGTAWSNDVWHVTGQQQLTQAAPYTEVTNRLDAFTGKIKLRLRGVARGGNNGDMAVDDIWLTGSMRKYRVTTPDAGTVPFDNVETADTTPAFEFSSTNVDGTATGIVYEIVWSTNADFVGASVQTRSSKTAIGFEDALTAGASAAFTPGRTIRFTIQPEDQLSNSMPNTAYYWRVRALGVGPDGEGRFGLWSDTHSFRINSGLSLARWVQTTDKQFQSSTLENLTSEGSNEVILAKSDNDSYLTGDDGIGNSGRWYAQIVRHNTPLTISKIRVLMLRASGATGTHHFYLRDTTGSPATPKTGILRTATRTYTNTDPTTNTWFEYTLDSSITLVAGRSYALVHERNGIVQWRRDGSTPTYANGHYCESTAENSGWKANTGRDFLFQLVGDPTTSGLLTSPAIDLGWVPGSNLWDRLAFTDNETQGTISYDVQYWDGNAWQNTTLTNQGSSPVDLNALDADQYSRIRLKATLAGAGGNTPRLQDWTVTWTQCVMISIADATLTEGDSGTSNAVFAVSLSGANGRDITVDFATSNGTALAGTDYVATNGTLTLPAGQTNATLAVAVYGDRRYEAAAKTFTLNLSHASRARIADAQGAGTILDNDPIPSMRISDVTVSEGQTGTTNAVFQVTLSNDSDFGISAAYASADGTALTGLDYVPTNGTVSFSPGQTNAVITVAVKGDALYEGGPETAFVNLTAPVNATLADAQGVLTIADDDPVPGLSAAPVSVLEGQTGTTPAVLTFQLTAVSALPVTFAYATSNGTAVAGLDYLATNGTASIPAGATNTTVTTWVLGDTLAEGASEVFYLCLSNVLNAAAATGLVSVTIADDDSIPVVSLAGATVVEGDSGVTSAVFNVTLSNPSVSNVTVDYVTSNGTASAGLDYGATSGTLTVAAGQLTGQFQVPVYGDRVHEGTETFVAVLRNPANATLGAYQAIGTITDDDPLPALTLNNATALEGDQGATNAVFELALSNPSISNVTVSFATSNGTATAGSDYLATNGVVLIPAGQTNATVSVVVLGDRVFEAGAETFFVHLEGPTNASVALSPATGTIIDDDPLPALLIGDVVIAEGNAGTTNALFALTLSNPSASNVWVSFSTSNGTAQAGTDYAATNGTTVIPAGQTNGVIAVTVFGDTLPETNETFTVELVNVLNAGAALPRGQATILETPVPAATSAITEAQPDGHDVLLQVQDPDHQARFLIAADGSLTNTWSPILVVTGAYDGFSHRDIGVVTNTPRRFYRIVAEQFGQLRTNPATFAMYTLPTETGKWYKLSMPVDVGASNRLDGELGAQLARGLGGSDAAGDLCYVLGSNGLWTTCLLTSNGTWAVRDTNDVLLPAAVTIEPWQSFWIKRRSAGSNTVSVYTGNVHTSPETVMFRASQWHMIAWPFPTPKREDEATIDGSRTNRGWGFAAAGARRGTGFSVADQLYVGDGNSAVFYYLNLDGRWCRAGFTTPASNLLFEAGQSYYYFHSGTGFVWTARETQP